MIAITSAGPIQEMLISILSLAFICVAQRTATALIVPDISNVLGHNVTGTVLFSQVENNEISIIVNITGLNPNSTHGWHVHTKAIENGNCSTAGLHFNPMNVSHGDRSNDITRRHFGDLGNMVADANGTVNLVFFDRFVSLFGNFSVDGLGIVIHEKIDDLGLGGANTSLTVGNSGSRLACGNIVRATGQNSSLSSIIYATSGNSQTQSSTASNPQTSTASSSQTQSSTASSSQAQSSTASNPQTSTASSSQTQLPATSTATQSTITITDYSSTSTSISSTSSESLTTSSLSSDTSATTASKGAAAVNTSAPATPSKVPLSSSATGFDIFALISLLTFL